MLIQILCIGKVKDAFNQKQIEEVCKRVNKGKHKIEIYEYPDRKIPPNLKGDGIEAFIEKEWERLSDKITNRDYVVALCIEGTEISTSAHREKIKKAMENEYHSIIYLIGGSLGLPKRLKERANLKFSFSKMTFPHQLMRMILCEEIEEVLRYL